MKKILVLVVVAIFLAGGLVLMSCGSNCPGDGNCKLDESSVLGWCSNVTKGDGTECFGAGATYGSKCGC
jgi:hypothetical protein